MSEQNDLSNQIRDLVAKDDIKAAIDLLKASLLDMDELNELILKSARYEALEKRERSGTLDYNTVELEKNKLRLSLLSFADSIKEGKRPAPSASFTPRPQFDAATTQRSPSPSYSPPAAPRTNMTPFIVIGGVLVLALVAWLMLKDGTDNNTTPPTEDTTAIDQSDIDQITDPATDPAPTQPTQPTMSVVEVNNVKDLLGAIRSNTQIKLRAGTYDLDEASLTWPGSAFIRFVDAKNDENGGALLTKVENLRITGEAGTRLITKDFSNDVLKMEGCTNVIFENLFLGHPEMDFCLGGVVVIKSSKLVKFINCMLHGSGIIGIKALQSELIEMDRSTIEVCSQNFLVAKNCSKVYFHDSNFQKSDAEIGFIVDDSPTVKIENCNIRNNQFRGVLFSINGNSVVKLTDSRVTATSYSKLVGGSTYSLYQEGSTSIGPN